MLPSDQVIAQIKKEFPSIHFVTKDTWFWKFLGAMVKVFTLGRNTEFTSRFVTTIGTFVALPTEWKDWPDFTKFIVLRHERIHLRQQLKYGFGSIWVGLLPWGLFWLFFPLPLGFAYGRYVIEREAYKESIQAWKEIYGPKIAVLERAFAVESLSGPAYAWCWPRHLVEEWFARNT